MYNIVSKHTVLEIGARVPSSYSYYVFSLLWTKPMFIKLFTIICFGQEHLCLYNFDIHEDILFLKLILEHVYLLEIKINVCIN